MFSSIGIINLTPISEGLQEMLRKRIEYVCYHDNCQEDMHFFQHSNNQVGVINFNQLIKEALV